MIGFSKKIDVLEKKVTKNWRRSARELDSVNIEVSRHHYSPEAGRGHGQLQKVCKLLGWPLDVVDRRVGSRGSNATFGRAKKYI